MAEFGTSVPTARDGGAAAPPKLIAASPPELCSPLAEDFVDSARGAALLVVRGTCDFFTKAKHANAAGAAMVIIVNTRGDPLSRMGVQPRWKSLNITAPVVMVSSAAGDALRAALEAAGGSGAAVARFTASPTVRAATWRVLGELEGGVPSGCCSETNQVAKSWRVQCRCPCVSPCVIASAARRAFSNVASSSMAIEKKAAEAHATGTRVGHALCAAQICHAFFGAWVPAKPWLHKSDPQKAKLGRGWAPHV